MGEGIDIAEVKRRLSCCGVAQHYGVALRRSGKRYLARCPFHDERSASFGIDARKELFHCFGCGAGGDVIELVRRFDHAADFPAALRRAAELAGITPGRALDRQAPRPRPLDPNKADEEDARQRERSRRAAYDIWKSSRPAAGTLVETYLGQARAIPIGLLGSLPSTIRFHGALRHADVNAALPAMVSAVQGPDDHFAGIHRTYLMMDGRGKAQLSAPKKMLGNCWRGAVRLGPATALLALAEGIETGLVIAAAIASARQHQAGIGPVSAWCALSLGNLCGAGLAIGAKAHPERPGMLLPSTAPDPERPGIVLPPIVRHVLLCIDQDERDRASAAALIDRAKARFQAEGRRVTVARPPAGQDFNDWLVELRGAAAA